MKKKGSLILIVILAVLPNLFAQVPNEYAAEVSNTSPTSSELGAPIYTNAKFFPEQSVQGGRVSTFAFVTNDRLEDVIKFYEKEFSKKADTENNLFYGFAGFNAEYPDDGIFMSKNSKGEVIIIYQLLAR